MPRLIEKPVGMPKEDAMRLPPLIHRKIFLRVTGISRATLESMMLDGDVRILRTGANRRVRMLYRDDALRICGYIKVEVTNGKH